MNFLKKILSRGSNKANDGPLENANIATMETIGEFPAVEDATLVLRAYDSTMQANREWRHIRRYPVLFKFPSEEKLQAFMKKHDGNPKSIVPGDKSLLLTIIPGDGFIASDWLEQMAAQHKKDYHYDFPLN